MELNDADRRQFKVAVGNTASSGYGWDILCSGQWNVWGLQTSLWILCAQIRLWRCEFGHEIEVDKYNCRSQDY